MRLENNRLPENDVVPEPQANPDTSHQATKPLAPWRAVFHSANAHKYGLGRTVQDRDEALRLYTKAAKLGAISAYWIIGNLHLSASKKSRPKAKAAFLQGTEAGNDLCWAGLAGIYFCQHQLGNWGECWGKYFSSTLFGGSQLYSEYTNTDAIMSNRAFQMYVYQKQAKLLGHDVSREKVVCDNIDEISAFLAVHEGLVESLVASIDGLSSSTHVRSGKIQQQRLKELFLDTMPPTEHLPARPKSKT